jgi:hypothetical protein
MDFSVSRQVSHAKEEQLLGRGGHDEHHISAQVWGIV